MLDGTAEMSSIKKQFQTYSLKYPYIYIFFRQLLTRKPSSESSQSQNIRTSLFGIFGVTIALMIITYQTTEWIFQHVFQLPSDLFREGGGTEIVDPLATIIYGNSISSDARFNQ